MTTKLTLTIDDSVVDSAKKYARAKGRSLSAVVENYLKTISATETNDTDISPRVLKLKGAIKLPDSFDYKAELGNVLAKKYQQ